jgi:hypothetical protein
MAVSKSIFVNQLALEKKTPQAFRVRGSCDEFSSSAQTPAPAAAKYYCKGEALGFHLSLMRNRTRMIQEKPKGCQRLSRRARQGAARPRRSHRLQPQRSGPETRYPGQAARL